MQSGFARARRVLLLAGVAVMLAVSVAPAVLAAPSKGDVNGNSAIDLGDVILCLRFAVGITTPTPEQKASADVAPVIGWGMPVGDRRVTIADAVRIVQALVGLVPVSELGEVPTNARFVGADVCRACHSTTHEQWQTTRHKDAFKNLKEYEGGKNATNPVCLACHTVGFGQPGGFVDEQTTPGMGGVQCESCHGPGSLHVQGGGDKTKILAYPKVLAAQVCGRCHTGSHQPQYEEWLQSKHVDIEPHVASYFAQGKYADRCGICHAGDAKVSNDYLGRGFPDAKTLQFAVPCATCHDPHMATGNDTTPKAGHDRQLRHPTSSQDEAKPNLCGQCHTRRSEDVWSKTSRPPHYSGQFTFLIGTGGFLPTADQPKTAHAFAPGQCVKCHMYMKEFESEENPAIKGHTYKVDLRGCAPCHTTEVAKTLMENTQKDIMSQLEALKSRLDKWGNWEFISNGGPNDPSNTQDPQHMIPEEVKKARWNYYWVLNDGSKGVHNAKYARELIKTANALLDSIGAPK